MHNVLAFRYPVRVLKCVPLHPIQNRSRYAYWKVRIPQVPVPATMAVHVWSLHYKLHGADFMFFGGNMVTYGHIYY